MKASLLLPTYATEVDRESAREKLAARMAPPTPLARPALDLELEVPPAPHPEPRRRQPRRGDEGAVVDFLQSREGRRVINTVARGVFGLLRKRR